MPITFRIIALQSSKQQQKIDLHSDAQKQITGGYKNGCNLQTQQHTKLQFAP